MLGVKWTIIAEVGIQPMIHKIPQWQVDPLQKAQDHF